MKNGGIALQGFQGIKKRNTELTHKYQTVFQVWQRNSVLIQCTTFDGWCIFMFV